MHVLMSYWVGRWIPNSGILDSKPLADTKVNSSFNPSDVD